MRLAALAAAVLAAVAIGACGASSSRTRASATASTRAAARPATAPDGVIRRWADTLRRGQIDAASRFFALPSVVSNGTGPIELRTRDDVRAFNESLPCGAVAIGFAAGPHGLVIATFRLTERPGPGTCGTGVGQTARTAFRIRNGRISEWLRVADLPQGRSQGTPA